MAKDSGARDNLNAIYDKVLGKGEPVGTAGRQAGSDGAYDQEDFSDDAGNGADPRDEQTQNSEGLDQNEDDAGTEDELDGADEADSNETSDDDDDAGEEEIPMRLVEAGRRANLADDVIVELAETKPHVLEALARSQEEAIRVPRQNRTNEADDAALQGDKKSEKGLKKIELNLDEDDEFDFSPKAKKVIEELVGRVNSLTGIIETHDQSFERFQKQSQAEGSRRIDEFFDRVSKDVPLLGTSKSLTKEQKDARLFAYRVAIGTQQAYNGEIGDEEALAIGVNALKGQLTEQQVKAKIVSDLDRNKKRFMARPKGRRQSTDGRHRSVEERSLEAIDKVLNDPKYR